MPAPPKILEYILVRLLPEVERESFPGDCSEVFTQVAESRGVYSARCWYLWQILKVLPSYIKNSFCWSVIMVANYLKITARMLKRNAAFSLLNISGLTVGLTAFILLTIYIGFELSYDRYHENAGQLYRVRNDRIYADIHDKSAGCPPITGPFLKETFPEVRESARIWRASQGGSIVTAYRSESHLQKVTFRLEGYEESEAVSVVGSFNRWRRNELPMERKEGAWVREILLPPGEYEYLFYVDRTYMIDPVNEVVRTKPNGDRSVLNVRTENYESPVTFSENRIYYAENSFLNMFTFPFVSGNRESALVEPNTVIISVSMAEKYFGDADPVNRTLALRNGSGLVLFRVTGVFEDIPEYTHLKFNMLFSFQTLISTRAIPLGVWGWNSFNTYVLLQSGTDPRALEADIAQALEGTMAHASDYRRELLLQDIRDIHLKSHLRWEPEVNGKIRTVYILMLIAGFILVVAWVNYINLSTARSVKRAKEVGVRKALGSRRGQLVKQFMFESGVLNIIAFTAAVVTAALLLPTFNNLTGKSFGFIAGFESWIMLVVIIAVGTLLSGLYPAFVLSSYKPVSVLKGTFQSSGKGINLRKALVLLQFAISIILIATTITVYNQIAYMQDKDLGIDIDQTLVLYVPDTGSISTGAEDRFRNEMLRLPGITDFTASVSVPGRDYSNVASGIRLESSPEEEGKRCFFIYVDDNYFSFFNAHFLAGRNFSEEQSLDRNSCIINKTAALMFGFSDPETALGNNIVFGGLDDEVMRIIGVTDDYHQESLQNSIEPVIYTQQRRKVYYSLKVDVNSLSGSVEAARDKWEEIMPGMPFSYFFLDDYFNSLYNGEQQFGKVFTLFSALALFVSCLGLFGLASFTAQQRTKEIGIRKTLGADTSGIIILLSRDFTAWIIFANLAAWPAAWYIIDAWLRNFAYRTTPGIWPFLAAGVFALLIAVLTVTGQSARAARANPVDSLRYE